MVARPPETTPNRFGIFPILTLVLVVLAALFIYKWGGAFRAVAAVRKAGAYGAPSELIATAGLPFLLACGARTVNYLATVWPALVFGVLIAGLVRAFVSAKDLLALVGPGVVRQQFIGGVIGMPLMLCSCCIAPIFSSFHAGGARLATSLAIMFSSPSLNVAALVLTFLLFPRPMALARMAMAIFAVLILPIIIEQLAGGKANRKPIGTRDWTAPESVADHPIQVIGRWARSSGTVAINTLPPIVLGVFASGFLVPWFQQPAKDAAPAGLTIALVALFATVIALPTFFEIPFGLLLLANDFPAGAVVAMLFAGPAINTPSLFTLARASSWKVALFAFLAVWSTATLGGLVSELWRP